MSVVIETNDPETSKIRSISAFAAQTARALQVCDLLEALADDLPRRQAPVWRETQHQCKSVLGPHFSFLVSDVLPTLLKRSSESADREDVLVRLMNDNQDQLDALEDLDDLMSEALISERFDQNAESLGYALRGYFETLRHNLRWELDVLWPLSKRILSVEDVRKLRAELSSSTALH